MCGVKRKVDEPMVVALHDGDIYHLIGDFNHHNQHAVLAGSGAIRYSSTHRVALTDGHSYRSIQRRCSNAVAAAAVLDGNVTDDPSSEQVHEEQQCIMELEFEWIRQFFIQGEAHQAALTWWHSKMAKLVALWRKLDLLSGVHTCLHTCLYTLVYTHVSTHTSLHKHLFANMSTHTCPHTCLYHASICSQLSDLRYCDCGRLGTRLACCRSPLC